MLNAIEGEREFDSCQYWKLLGRIMLEVDEVSMSTDGGFDGVLEPRGLSS